MTLAIIGGSGFDKLPNFDITEQREVSTPYGKPSAPISFGKYNGSEIVFLPRHGDDHSIAPHKINYRANMYGLKDAGVTEIIGLAVVGGINPDYPVRSIVVPHQIIDYTTDREHTFYDGEHATNTHVDNTVKHIKFTEPYDHGLRVRLVQAARQASIRVNTRGVYAATQGPRLESAAEIDRLQRDGAEIVGMTAMPEAALARELNIIYAALTPVVNAAAGRGDQELATEKIYENLAATVGDVLAILEQFVSLP